jgi:uncharacterized protein (DUF362 family)
MTLQPNRVFCAKAAGASYERLPGVRFPELPPWTEATTALVALRSLLAQTGLDRSHLDSPDWNPLGGIIREGTRVLVKPNWVSHHNSSGRGIDCLVTHASVIEAILHYVAIAHPSSVVVGDAPVQGCDFGTLMAACGLPEMIDRFTADGVNVSIKDFRRTIHPTASLGGRARENCRPLDDFILYDVGCDSALEAITRSDSEFRVTMYNPDALKSTHAPGKHQYLVARDAIEADVVLNVPKLKTHRKAGITGALKNVVGINGHKEYLPHHRKGGSASGGDCYVGQSTLKGLIEDLLDATNRAEGRIAKQVLANAVRVGKAVGKVSGVDRNYEGSWHGNDTVWRMSLDLQRVLHYGRIDGTLADQPQRTVLTVTDAIIAGEGDGPLAPSPVKLGMLTLAANTAAAEWAHALLMGFDPEWIPLTREAFAAHRYPLTSFRPGDVAMTVDGIPVPAAELFARHGCAFRPADGWREHCELRYSSRAS